jgi:hypothetical protein
MNLLNKIIIVAMLFSSVNMLPQNVTACGGDTVKVNTFAPKVIKKYPLENMQKPEIFINEYEQRKENFTSSYLFKGLITGAVALGVTAAYYKMKADDRFDKYNRLKEQKFLDETRKFDWISGISFSALQINLGFLIYFFLIE